MHTTRRTLAALLAGAGVFAGVAAAGYADIVSTVGLGVIVVGNAQTPVLTDATGRTLYYFMLDTATKSACTSDCARMWPPLLSTLMPTSGDRLPGALTVVKTANGQQVAYNGHLLYTYSGDAATGQANGQGIDGKWWVATVALTPASVSTFPPPSSGYSGEREGGKGGGGGGMGGGY